MEYLLFADDAKDAYNLMIKYVSKAERAVKKLKSKKLNKLKNSLQDLIFTKLLR